MLVITPFTRKEPFLYKLTLLPDRTAVICHHVSRTEGHQAMMCSFCPEVCQLSQKESCPPASTMLDRTLRLTFVALQPLLIRF